MSGRIITLRVDGTVYSIDVPKKRPGLELLQREVGGYIEPVKVRWEGRLREAYVDEDGFAKRLSVNPRSSSIDQWGRELLGPIVIWIPTPKPPAGGPPKIPSTEVSS